MKEISKDKLYEKVREKVFFYVTYQKRTEAEIKRTFAPIFKKYNISNELLVDLIEELKEKGYIDDEEFLKKKFISFINLNNFSIKEMEYKLINKGISKDLINKFIEKNQDRIKAHQIKAVNVLYKKKINEKSEEDIKQYLRKKGFEESIIELIDTNIV